MKFFLSKNELIKQKFYENAAEQRAKDFKWKMDVNSIGN